MQIDFRISWVLGMLLLLVTSLTAAGQVVPDTVYRKQELPAGPPGEVPVQTRPRTQPNPPVIQQPPVVRTRPDSLQYEEKVPLLNRLYYGGGFGLQFGTFTNVSLSPILGYMVTEKFWAGGGLLYDYLGSRVINLQNYGVKAFAQYEVISNFLVHAEYNQLSVQLYRITNGSYEKYRRTAGIPLAGLGYRQRIGPRASSDILVLYNFDTANYGLYSNPVIRFSLNIPFRSN